MSGGAAPILADLDEELGLDAVDDRVELRLRLRLRVRRALPCANRISLKYTIRVLEYTIYMYDSKGRYVKGYPAVSGHWPLSPPRFALRSPVGVVRLEVMRLEVMRLNREKERERGRERERGIGRMGLYLRRPLPCGQRFL